MRNKIQSTSIFKIKMKITPTSNQRPLILDAKSSTDRDFLSQLSSRTPCLLITSYFQVSGVLPWVTSIWSISHYLKTGDVDDILSLGDIGHLARFFQSRFLSVKYWWILKFQYYHGYKWAHWILNKERRLILLSGNLSVVTGMMISKRGFLIPENPYIKHYVLILRSNLME